MKMSKTELRPSNTRSVRVRYSRLDEKRSPKNTLYTKLEGESLYFGIARCNVKLDTFVRSVGSHIAEERANRALTETENSNYATVGSLSVHRSGLRGSVSRSNVKELIEYFRSVDERLLDQLNTSRSVEAE